jgi:hypothetical protein
MKVKALEELATDPFSPVQAVPTGNSIRYHWNEEAVTAQ